MQKKNRSNQKASPGSKKKKRRWVLRVALLLLVLFVLVVVAFHLRDLIAKPIVESQVSKALNCRVRLKRLSTHPFSGQASIEGLTISSPAGFPERDFITLEEAQVECDVRPLLRGDIHLRKLHLSKLTVNITTSEDGRNNLALFLRQFMPAEPTEEKENKAQEQGVGFQLDQLQVSEGKVVITDRREGCAMYNLVAHNLQVQMGPISSRGDPTLNPGPFKTRGVIIRQGKEGLLATDGKFGVVGGKTNFDLDVRAYRIDVTGLRMNTGVGTRLVAKQGILSFRSKAHCKDNRLDCENHIIIEDLKLAGGNTASGILFGIPVVTFNSFIGTTRGKLYIPFSIKGTISNPEPDFTRSFQHTITAGPAMMLKMAQQATGTIFGLGVDMAQIAIELGQASVEVGGDILGKTAETAVDVGKAAAAAAKSVLEKTGAALKKLIPGKSDKDKEKDSK